MSIISGFETVKEYIKNTDGYKAISRWTSSHTVEMDNGNTLEEEIGNIEKGCELTQEEYNNLSEEEKNNGTIYYIKDGDTNLSVVLLTKSEYESLGDSVNNDGKIYLITDDDYNESSKDVFYNNTNSNLESTNVQDAIDEVSNSINFLNDNLGWNIIGTATNNEKLNFPSNYNDYNEFVFFVKNTSQSTPTFSPLSIPLSLVGTDCNIVGGFYISDSDNFSVKIRLTANRECYVLSAKNNSVEFSNISSLLTVYGKI